MKPLHLAAAVLMVTIWGVALRVRPFGADVAIPSSLLGTSR